MVAGCMLSCLLTGRVAAAGRADSIPSVTIPWLEGKNNRGDLLERRDWEGAGTVDIKPPWNTRAGTGTVVRDAARTVATVRFFFDDSLLYFAFDVEDTTINLFTYGDEMSVTKGDRVELFFAPSLELHDYFCWEISPAGKVLDYRAKYKRQFDNSWYLPGVTVVTHLWSRGYTVSGGIPMSFIRRWWKRAPGESDSHEIYAGVFSADFYGEKEEEVVWNSWVAPRSDKPDFHIPSAFGRFVFCSGGGRR